jgi:hypothetical protein
LPEREQCVDLILDGCESYFGSNLERIYSEFDLEPRELNQLSENILTYLIEENLKPFLMSEKAISDDDLEQAKEYLERNTDHPDVKITHEWKLNDNKNLYELELLVTGTGVMEGNAAVNWKASVDEREG